MKTAAILASLVASAAAFAPAKKASVRCSHIINMLFITCIISSPNRNFLFLFLPFVHILRNANRRKWKVDLNLASMIRLLSAYGLTLNIALNRNLMITTTYYT